LVPQPSSIEPQLTFNWAQVFGVQAVHTLLMHISLVSQVPVPHVNVRPQPSDIVPQSAPLASHVVGVHTSQKLFLQV
jgi:hypothetical protein